MLRQAAAIFLLVAFAMQAFYREIIVLDYHINKASFSQNCENKAFPQMHCHGRCQLLKKLKQQEQKEQQIPQWKGESKNGLFFPSSFFTLHHIHPDTGHAVYFAISSGNTLDRPKAIFHPPNATHFS